MVNDKATCSKATGKAFNISKDGETGRIILDMDEDMAYAVSRSLYLGIKSNRRYQEAKGKESKENTAVTAISILLFNMTTTEEEL